MIFATGRVEEKLRVLWRRALESYDLSAFVHILSLKLPWKAWPCSASEKSRYNMVALRQKSITYCGRSGKAAEAEGSHSSILNRSTAWNRSWCDRRRDVAGEERV